MNKDDKIKDRWDKSKIIKTKNTSSQMSEKKLKLQSLLSLPSFPSLPTTKKPLLKPLQLSDIIVAMVEDQLSVDRTKDLKSYLTKNRKQTVSLDQQEVLIASPLDDLPQFAKKEWGFRQLLQYHIERKRPNVNEEIAVYQKKLVQIEREFSNSLERYKYQLEQGKNSIQQIQQKVNSLYSLTHESKYHIHKTSTNLGQFSSKIMKLNRRQQNLKKTIAIARAWSKSNISKILSINLNHLQNTNIISLLKQIDNCSEQIKEQGVNKQLQNSDKVLKVIEQRRTTIIDRVQKNMQFAIVDFTDIERYERVYLQYNDLLKSLAWSDEQKFKQYHQLQKGNIEGMIQDNVDFVYWQALGEVSTIDNIELLREDTYVGFVRRLIQKFSEYLVNWHKATSYHVKAETEHKDNCMKMMEDVADRIIKKVFHLLKYSQKFFSLSFSHKVKIILEVDKIVVFIEEWTGKKDLSLFQILREKLKTEVDNFRKEINGSLKVLFVEEFSEEGLMSKLKRKGTGDEKEDDLENRKIEKSSVILGANQSNDQMEKIRLIATNKLFRQQFSINENSNKKPSSQTQLSNSLSIQIPNLTQIISNLAHETFELSLTKSLYNSITQYLQRQQLLPLNHLTHILQHVQFLILLIFKVCVHEDTKSKMIESFSQRPFAHLKTIEAAVQKNPTDQSLLHSLARMRQAFMVRRNYLELHHFLANEIDDKFDNLVVTGFVNINKLYLNPQENTQVLMAYHSRVSKMIEELLKITRWLSLLFPHFPHSPHLTRKLELLPIVLIQLTFLYFQHHNHLLSLTYFQTLEPIMKNLKWKIDKFNHDTTHAFRQYKLAFLQIYRSSTMNIGVKDKELFKQLANKQLEVFYKSLLTLYCKIDKINDNGRQVVRLDAMEISKILTEVGADPGSWAVWFEKFIQATMQRSIKTILDKIQQLGIVYPITCWKSQLLWIVNNLSTKEKKQYTTHLLKIYLDQLKCLPEL